MVAMGDVWDRTTGFLGDHVGTLMPIVILAIFLPSSVTGSLADLQMTAGPGMRIVLALVSIAASIVTLWAELAIVALAIDPALGRGATQVATARLLPAIGIFLLVILVAILAALPLVAILMTSGIDLAAMRAGQATMSMPSPGYALILMLATIAYLIVLLFVGARLTTLIGVVVAERRGAGAIARAFALSRGLTWKIVGVILLYGVVAIVSILAVQTVFGSILRIIAGGPGGGSIAGVLTAIAVAGVSTAFTVLAMAFYGKLYLAVVRARELPAGVSLS